MDITPPLLPILKDLLQKEGSIPLSKFMEICLYHPTYGYYIQHSPIGSSQDFITAPEVSQLFGEMIGLFFADLWEKIGSPASFSFVEFGPGKGTLLADILRVFHKLSLSPTLYLLETNKTLQEAQEKTLSPFKIPIQWFSSLEELLPHLLPQFTFFLGNEFLDTFPIDQYIFQEDKWWKKGITWSKTGLEHTLMPVNVIPLLDSGIQDNLKDAWIPRSSRGMTSFQIQGDNIRNDKLIIEHSKKKSCHAEFISASLSFKEILKQVQDDNGKVVTEYSEKQLHFLETLCAFHLKHPQSFSLFIDYGYTQGFGDTFQALRNHKYVDPLDYPGTCDLTAHVNFQALSCFVQQRKLQVYGPTTQGNFLQSLGINIRAQNLAHKNPSHEKSLKEALYRLTSPSQMGTLFKVWGFSPLSLSPSGF